MPSPERESLSRRAVSGLIAAVIFVVIAVLTGGSATFVVVGAIVVFVLTTLIAFAIGTLISRNNAA